MGFSDLSEVELVISILEKEGATDIASTIRHDMKHVAYTTGTEFFFGIVENLDPVKTSSVSEATKARAAKLQKDILAFIKIGPKV